MSEKLFERIVAADQDFTKWTEHVLLPLYQTDTKLAMVLNPLANLVYDLLQIDIDIGEHLVFSEPLTV